MYSPMIISLFKGSTHKVDKEKTFAGCINLFVKVNNGRTQNIRDICKFQKNKNDLSDHSDVAKLKVWARI